MMSPQKPRTQELIEEIVNLSRADRLVVRSGIEPSCLPTPRIAIHHPENDFLFSWDTGLHGLKYARHSDSEQEADPNLTPSLLDYIETIEYINANPTELDCVRLKEELLEGFRADLLTSTRRIVRGNKDLIIQNWRSFREQPSAQSALTGVSEWLVAPPKDVSSIRGFARLSAVEENLNSRLYGEQRSRALFGGRSPEAVAHEIRTFTGKEPHVLDAFQLYPGCPLEYSVTLRLSEKYFAINLLTSDLCTRNVHGLEVVPR